jgi:hypothetical protein
MNDQSIIQAISVIVAAGLGGVLTYLGSRSKDEARKLNEKLDRACPESPRFCVC